MRELQEEHSMHSRNEIIEVLDEVNAQYRSNFKLKTRNIITAPNLGNLPDEDMSKLIKLDACQCILTMFLMLKISCQS